MVLSFIDTLKLAGGRIARSQTETCHSDLTIANGRVASFNNGLVADDELDLDGCLVLPGLINAHDHLELNLFPRLGHGPYSNASTWAEDIYRPNESPIREQLKVPKHDRYVWGALKNLVCGVTTVAHHNAMDPSLFNANFPVRVLKHYGWAHSLHFSVDVESRYRSNPPDWPFFIHAAEGTDEIARAEIWALEEKGLLSERTVVVHAVGAGPLELLLLHARGASIVWCPSSNLFTLGNTIDASALRSGIPIALGNDSAVTAAGDLRDEIDLVVRERRVSCEEVFDLVITNPARMLRKKDSTPGISENAPADLVAVTDRGQSPSEALVDLSPELVLVRGQIKLVSEQFARRLSIDWTRHLHPLKVEKRGSFLVDANTPALLEAATRVLEPEIRLAGKQVRA